MKYDRQRNTLLVEVYGEDDEGDYSETLELPAKFEVCDRCQGRGTHVAPGIDDHGLTAEDFAEDPDFAEDYWSGFYDVQCSECHGRNVVPVPNWAVIDPKTRERVEEQLYREECYRIEAEHERRMGY